MLTPVNSGPNSVSACGVCRGTGCGRVDGPIAIPVNACDEVGDQRLGLGYSKAAPCA